MAGKGQKWPEIDLKLMEMDENDQKWIGQKILGYMQNYVAAELA